MLFISLLLIISGCQHALAATYPPRTQKAIRTFMMNPKNLWENRKLFKKGRRELNPAIKRVLKLADKAVNDPATYTVTSKSLQFTAPSNDTHDYFTLARYFWPNASSSNGLPYARFDGHVNPEIYLYQDAAYLKVVLDDISNCALAYFFTGNESYAQVATKRMRDWFIVNETAMNPNLNFANWVTGIPFSNDSTDFTFFGADTTIGGLLDMREVYSLIDSIGILTPSEAFTWRDYDAMVSWLSAFKSWLEVNQRAQAISSGKNNQATWYDVQYVAILLFLNKTSDAEAHLRNNTMSRLGIQVGEDGSQPFEMARSESWYYSVFNVQALFALGYLSQSTSFNVFDAEINGTSVQTPLDYLIPFALNNGTSWPVANTGSFNTRIINQICKDAYIAYRDKKYITASDQIQNFKPETWNPARLSAPFASIDTATRKNVACKSSVSYMTTVFSLLVLLLVIQ